jgi:hypothetical protein
MLSKTKYYIVKAILLQLDLDRMSSWRWLKRRQITKEIRYNVNKAIVF